MSMWSLEASEGGAGVKCTDAELFSFLFGELKLKSKI